MLLDGCEEILAANTPSARSGKAFDDLFARIRTNWRARGSDRWPSPKNWQLRQAIDVKFEADKHFEKQLEKSIVAGLADQGWGNAVPTSSGLVNSHFRQMNIDLAHRVPGGFEFIELKWQSNNPVSAANQVFRYAAIYMLYRLEPEIRARFPSNEMLNASILSFEVLAPHKYYNSKDDLRAFEMALDEQLKCFCTTHLPNVDISFCFKAFPGTFTFSPGMSSDAICTAVLQRTSPFVQL